jgi:4-amino-4-deoxy-L-arabinose transferase-like glycosyltransferase
VFGIARRIGLCRREALFGGLVVATLPILALQASSAQNDLVVASFLVAAVLLLLDGSRFSPYLAALATALAVGTKTSAVVGLPFLSRCRSLCVPRTVGEPGRSPSSAGAPLAPTGTSSPRWRPAAGTEG